MTLSLDKTWVVSEYVINNNSDANITNGLLVGIKNLFKAHGWSVASCSDGVTTPIVPATDYWIDYTNIINNTGSHSWVVLTNSNISANFAFCIDCNVTSSGYQYHNFYCCTSGYNTDGTISARPTVAGGGYEVTLLASSSVWHYSEVNRDSKAILFNSSDYKCYRLFISGSAYNSIWIFDVPKDPPGWWTIPYVASISLAKSLCPAYSTYCLTTTTTMKSDLASSVVNFGLGSIGNSTGAHGSTNVGRKQDFDGYFVMSPTYLISNTTARPGIYGTLYDLYWTSIGFELALPKSSGFLATEEYDRGLIVFGSFAQGNDGSAHTIGY
jgi:hypothetical protein